MARKGTLSKTFTLPDGTRKWIYAKTEEELKRKCLDLQIQIGLGIDLTNNDTFGEYAQMWYKTYKEPHLRSNSKTSLLYVLNEHILPHLSGYRMRDITPMHIQLVFNKVQDKSESLNSKIKTTLNEVFNSAIANNIIFKSPIVKTLNIGGAKAKEKEALTPEDSNNLLAGLKSDTSEGGKQCHLFCSLALKSGLRRGELCGLMWSDIDFERSELTVTHNCTWPNNTGLEITGDLKTDAASRTIPLTADVLALLAAEKLRGKSLYVFHRNNGEPMTQAAFRRMFAHANKHLDSSVALSPHILRHTYCTRLFEAGLDVKEIQYLMGHSTPEMTMRVYTHYSRRSRYDDTAQRVRAAL